MVYLAVLLHRWLPLPRKEFFHGRQTEVPAVRLGGRQGERVDAFPLPRMREDVLAIDVDRHVVEEACRRQALADGQHDGQRLQAQGDKRRRRHIQPHRLRMEDEGLRRRLRDPEKRDVVRESVD